MRHTQQNRGQLIGTGQGKRGRHTVTVIGLLALLMLLLASVPSAVASSPAPAGERDEPEREQAVEIEPTFELELPNGNQLSFIPLPGPEGRIAGYGVAETLQPRTPSYEVIPELRDADAAEVAFALTPRDVEVPYELFELHGKPELAAEQGWGLPQLEDAGTYIPFPIPNRCDTETFADDFPSWSATQTVSFYDGAGTNALKWDIVDWDSSGGYGIYKTIRKRVADSYHMKVTRCGSNLASNMDPGVRLTFTFGFANPGGGDDHFSPYSSAYINLGSLAGYGSTVDFAWVPNLNYEVNTYKWELMVHHAEGSDQFHIGHGAGQN